MVATVSRGRDLPPRRYWAGEPLQLAMIEEIPPETAGTTARALLRIVPAWQKAR